MTSAALGRSVRAAVVLMPREFRAPLLAFTRETRVAGGLIDPGDLDRAVVTHSPEEAARIVAEAGLRQLGLSYGPRIRRRWFLGE